MSLASTDVRRWLLPEAGLHPAERVWYYLRLTRTKRHAMSTATVPTTLKLSEDLKARVLRMAAESGRSPHAFMLEAIARYTEMAERRREFVASALLAEQEVSQYGLVHDSDEALSWFLARTEGRRLPAPRKRKL